MADVAAQNASSLTEEFFLTTSTYMEMVRSYPILPDPLPCVQLFAHALPDMQTPRGMGIQHLHIEGCATLCSIYHPSQCIDCVLCPGNARTAVITRDGVALTDKNISSSA